MPRQNRDDDYLDDETEPSPVTSTIRNTGPKLGRNDPCWCGSGKKYKKCHHGKDAPG
jgi:preprotein translocase subunit SecA